jgi:acyl-coenzyme A thioesterase 9
MTPVDTSLTERLQLSSDSALRRRYMVTDEPVRANIRVGLLLEFLDKLAERTALRYLRLAVPEARVVTAAMDDLSVLGAPDVERDLVFLARINFVGNTSMEVGIRIEQPFDGSSLHIASCYFTMAARLEERGIPLPSLEYSSDEDKRRAGRAQERKRLRREPEQICMPTLSEYAMLQELHKQLETRPETGLRAAELLTSGWERTYPEYENVPQTIFGGYVIHRAYMYAHICAEMVADHRPLLVYSSRIDFLQPVRMGDKLHFVSRITYSGKTSLTVETSITRISRDRRMTALSNNCLFTFVNVDAELQRMPVPRVLSGSYSEDVRYLSAHRQHQQHLLGLTA